VRAWLTATVVLAATVAFSRAGAAASDDKPPVIDVIVTDAKGRVVPTLTAADFKISEQGQSRPVTAARFARGDRRIVAIFLDEFHTAAGDAAARVTAALARIVRSGLASGDEIVVFKPLDSILTITTTTDHDAAARAIEGFDPRKGNYEPRTPFEQTYIAGAPARIDAARGQIALSALNALATHLASLGDGRKTLVVVADGLGRRAKSSRGEPLPTLDTVRRAADGGGVAIYTLEVNRAGEDAGDLDAREALRALAAETGGRAIAPTDDPGDAIAAALADASGYYVVTLQADAAPDGKFHPLDVRVAATTLTVRARRGYVEAAPAEARLTSALTPSTIQLATGPPRRTSPLIRAWFGQSPGGGSSTRVSFVWEPAPFVPAGRGAAMRPARVALSITRQDDGTPVFDGVVTPSNGGGSIGVSDRSEASFELPPGRVLVQMKIQDAGARVLDTDVRDLVVGTFNGPMTIGTAEVYRARSARELRSITADPGAAPVAARQFSRADTLLIRVPVSASGEPPTVTARLVSRFGSALRDLAAARGAENVYEIDLPLASLATGDYAVEVNATAAGKTARETVPIRVTP
jgi:VWFA-related protein